MRQRTNGSLKHYLKSGFRLIRIFSLLFFTHSKTNYNKEQAPKIEQSFFTGALPIMLPLQYVKLGVEVRDRT